jgi:hypothetical protein
MPWFPHEPGHLPVVSQRLRRYVIMTTTLRSLIKGVFFWRATIESDDATFSAMTVFPASMAKADVVRAIVEKSPEMTIDDSLMTNSSE